MSRRILVVSCHPLDDGLVGAARERALHALATGAAEVRHRDLYAEGFDPELTADEHRTHVTPGVGPDLESYADDLRWADTLVFVHPTWWGGQPAMLKGWIDRVFAAGIAWELPEGANRLVPRLRHVRRIVAVTTHGSSKFVNSLQGEPGKRTLLRSIRVLCHPLARTSWIALYGVDTSTAEQRDAFLDRVERRLTRLAR